VLLKEGQIAIDDNQAEIYGKVRPPDSNRQIVVRVYLHPESDSNQLVIDTIKIGYLSLPSELAYRVARTFADVDISELLSLDEKGIRKIDFGDKVANFTLDVSDFLDHHQSD
jgi:hypothetical protein